MIKILKVIWMAFVFLVTGRRTDPPPRCAHEWKVTAADPIPAVHITHGLWEDAREAAAPMTRISFVCVRCGKTAANDRRGSFKLEDFPPRKEA